MCLRRCLAWAIKKSSPGRILDAILGGGFIAVLVLNGITLLTMGIIPLSDRAVGKLGQCTLFIRTDVDGELVGVDSYGSNICIFTIVAPCVVGVCAVAFILYFALKICINASITCIEILLTIFLILVLLFAISNACIITFGFLSSCLELIYSPRQGNPQNCGSGIWQAATNSATYDVFDALNAAQSSAWFAVVILSILSLIFVVRSTIFVQRKKHGSGMMADAANLAGMV